MITVSGDNIKTYGAAFLILAVFVAIFFYPFFLQGKVYTCGDILLHWYKPWNNHNPIACLGRPSNPELSDTLFAPNIFLYHTAKCFRGREFPLWDPYTLCGYPLYAIGGLGCFYPLNYIVYFMPGDLYVNATFFLVILQTYLLGLFTFIYARSLKLSRISSCAAAVIAMFSGSTLPMAEHYPVMSSFVWLPLFMYGFDEYALRENRKWIFLAPLLFGVAMLGGNLKFLYYNLIFFGVYIAYRTLEAGLRKEAVSKAVIFTVCFFIIGFAIGAVQIVPLLDFMKHSVRGETTFNNFNPGWLLQNLLNCKNFLKVFFRVPLTYLMPNLFGNPSHLTIWFKYPACAIGNYLGIATLFLILFSFIRKNATIIFFTLTAIFLIAVHIQVPVLSPLFVFLIPGTGSGTDYVYPIASLLLAFAAAYGMDNIIAEPKHILLKRFFTLRKGYLIIVAGILIGGFLIFVLRDRIAQALQEIKWTEFNKAFGFPKDIQGFWRFWFYQAYNVLFFSVFLSLSIVILGLLARGKISKTVFKTLLTIVIFTDLFLWGSSYCPRLPARYQFMELPFMNKIKEIAGTSRIFGYGEENAFPQNIGSVYGIYDLGGRAKHIIYSNYHKLTTAIFPNAPPPRYKLFWVSAGDISRLKLPILDFMGLKCLLASEEVPFERELKQKFSLAFVEDGIFVYENKEVLPKAFLVNRYKVILSGDERLKYCVEELDPRREVVVSNGSGLEKYNLTSNDTFFTSSAQVKHYGYNDLEIEASAPCDTLLVVNDILYPGWHVYVDGKETPILEANYAFRAVPLNSGDHKIRFQFSPYYFKPLYILSLAAMLTTLSLTVCVALLQRRKGKLSL